MDTPEVGAIASPAELRELLYDQDPDPIVWERIEKNLYSDRIVDGFRDSGTSPPVIYSLYALGDPRDGSIFKVGCTKNLTRRYAEHKTCSNLGGSTRGQCLSIKQAGLKPVLVLLTTTTDIGIARLQEHEYHEIHGLDFCNEYYPRR